MVYIKVGRLMSRSVITDFLEAVLLSDLEGLKSICVRTVPHKATKKRLRRWGALFGQYSKGRIWLYLWGITQDSVKFSPYYNSPYCAFMKLLAKTFYHEIGHHVASFTESYKINRERFTQITSKLKKLDKLGRSRVMVHENGSEWVVTCEDEYGQLADEKRGILRLSEKPAEGYADKILMKAKARGLLTTPKDENEIRFCKIICDRKVKMLLGKYATEKQNGFR